MQEKQFYVENKNVGLNFKLIEYRWRACIHNINRYDSYRVRYREINPSIYQSMKMIVIEIDIERSCSVNQSIEMIVIDIERERLLYFSTNRDDSYRYRYREVVPSINQWIW